MNLFINQLTCYNQSIINQFIHEKSVHLENIKNHKQVVCIQYIYTYYKQPGIFPDEPVKHWEKVEFP